ncbi:MAG: flagellar basal body P-ring protein FlgI [bacterium]|nr:flagellar basal body P-ring protein FlgI [bacterium]
MQRRYIGLLLLALICLSALTAQAARIKDIAMVNGVDGEHLIGYGIIVGLAGTGDGAKTGFTNHSVASMMEKFGHTLDPDDIKLKNVAAVMVTAKLPPYSLQGDQMDVTVSSLGDATSLDGGILLMTPLLRQADGLQYAISQGPVSLGGFNVEAGEGNSLRTNHTTVGMVINGGKLVRDWEQGVVRDNRIELLLHSPDFTTATNIAKTVNEAVGTSSAQARGAGRVSIWIPSELADATMDFISRVENLRVATDLAARVVINERTGTVVVGQNVTIKDVAIAHGNLRVEIRTGFNASQPNAFGSGTTLLVPDIRTSVSDDDARLAVLQANNTVEQVARSLNELGVSPRDMVAIFQALKRSGALEAELVIM